MLSRATDPRARVWNIGARLERAGLHVERPDWQEASPRWIAQAFEQSRALPTGGWYALCASRFVDATVRRLEVAGREVVVWRDGDELYAAPGACPHLGASLEGARVRNGCFRCRWHGLELGAKGHGAWRPLPTHDDGVLFWIRLADGDPPTPRPIIPKRPARFIDAVVRVEAHCEPEDVIQNRLDPWHGVHLHPYAFARVRVLAREPASVTVRVAYRVLGPACVEVDARFCCVDRRTVVMTIIAGDGQGSVVETHATPIGIARTAIVEATLATSNRPLFRVALAAPSPFRAIARRAMRGLWRDDAAYAERLHALRRTGHFTLP